jgi:broad-specificity NMP kinase
MESSPQKDYNQINEENELLDNLDAAEMFHRWEMQESPPDLLITNVSMLSIMLMRHPHDVIPDDRADSQIFETTKEWLAEDRENRVFQLVIDELHLYRQLYDHFNQASPRADLVIYLQAAPATLNERIRRRGVQSEEAISENYLERVCESYSRFFHHYDTSPLLIVNTEHLNPVENSEDFDLLMQRIFSMRGKREFFNRGE